MFLFDPRDDVFHVRVDLSPERFETTAEKIFLVQVVAVGAVEVANRPVHEKHHRAGQTGTLDRFPGDAGKRVVTWSEQRIASVNFRKEVFAVWLFFSFVLAVLGFLCIAGRRDDPRRRS